MSRPPFLARLLLELVPARHREFIIGDLEEEYVRRLSHDGWLGAGAWYWRQAIASLISESRHHKPIVELGEPKRGSMFDTLRQDLRYTFRSLNARPVFTTVAILTLALGIGANTGIYSIANWLLLRPVPGVSKPEEMAVIDFGQPTQPVGISWANLSDLQQMTTSFQGIAGTASATLQVLSDGAPPQEVMGMSVGGDYFGLLGVRMQKGRAIFASETRPGHPTAIAVISDRLWTELFARDPAVVGQTLRANQLLFTVVGVAPKGFAGTERLSGVDLWVPFSIYADLRHQDQAPYYMRGTGYRFFEIIGRLKPGVTAPAAESDLQRAMSQLIKQYPKDNEVYTDRPAHVYAGIGVRVLLRERTELIVTIMLGVVALLLVISSANVANMLLVRAVQRRSEAATRRALGASSSRLAIQQIVESLVLALLGGLAGLIVAGAFLKFIEGGRIFGFPPIEDVPIDGRVLVFALGICLLTGLIFGLAPLSVLRKLNLTSELVGASGRQVGGGLRARNGIAVVQVALSLVLLVGALLLGRTLNALLRVDLGFDLEGLAGMSISPEPQGYKRDQIPALGGEILAQVRRSAAVEAAALSYSIPFSCCGYGWRIKDPLQRSEEAIRVDVQYVSDDFFRTLGIAILRGRALDTRDWVGANRREFNVVLSETGAQRLFGDRDPLGQTIVTSNREPNTLRVVGIARDARMQQLGEPMPDLMYWPLHAMETGQVSVIARSKGKVELLEPEMRAALARVNPAFPPRYQIVGDNLRNALAEQRLLAALFMLFSTLAVLLAAIGLYGVLGSNVAERRREFGLRMALGAAPRRIFDLVALQSARLVATGLALGLVTAYWLSRYLESQLVGVRRQDPSTYIAAALLFVAIAAIATAVPTRSATRVNPIVALRQE